MAGNHRFTTKQYQQKANLTKNIKKTKKIKKMRHTEDSTNIRITIILAALMVINPSNRSYSHRQTNTVNPLRTREKKPCDKTRCQKYFMNQKLTHKRSQQNHIKTMQKYA